MFRSTSLFIGTSFTVAVFTIFATSNVDSIVGVPHKIYSMQRILIHIKKNRPLLNVPICTQGMERTWWPEAGTIIVTGPYWPDVTVLYVVYKRDQKFTPAYFQVLAWIIYQMLSEHSLWVFTSTEP